MRATLSPAFTASKMRQMFELIAERAGEMAQYFQKQTQTDGFFDCNIKDAFGWKMNTLEDRDNEYYLASIELGLNSGWKVFKYIIISALPTLTKLLGIELFDRKICKYFETVVLDKYRCKRTRRHPSARYDKSFDTGA